MELHSKFARKLGTFLPLTGAELDCLASMQSQPRRVERGRQLTEEGQTGHQVFILLDGWTCSYKDLPNGSRQIISFPLAGDWWGCAACSCEQRITHSRR